jgi:hypothetical protein
LQGTSPDRKDERPPVERRSEKGVALDKAVRADVNEITSTKAGTGSRPARFDRRNREIEGF